MTKRVHILPTIADGPDPGHGGIHRVIVGQRQTLPRFGWEVVDSPEAADIIACHVEVPAAYTRLYREKPVVVHNHGLYWTDGGYPWEPWCYNINQKALDAIRLADAVTAVSDWTAQALRRASLRDVRTIYHGIDLAEWTPLPASQRERYVLWNKTRVDPICDTLPLNEAAQRLPHVRFVSTFGLPADNIDLVGRAPYEQAREMVRRASVYLATTRETFGIGTLEALAAGVPVVGFDFGGQREIITHGVDGWLVLPEDYAGLAEGIEWALANRDEIAVRARQTAERFPVERSGEQYALLYDDVLEREQRLRAGPRVSVIVPAFNMGDYLDDTLRSVQAQEGRDWECIVVDDASPDERDREIGERYARTDERFRYVRLNENGYLANARNVGIQQARGRYIFPLDADDQMEPNTIGTLADVLDAEKGLHIAYGNVRFVEADGQTPMVYAEGQAAGLQPGHSRWPIPFRLDWMLLGPGQLLPYASMYRRSVWERTGGYRTRCRSSEDQDFWLRATSYGFTARMVTEADTLVYRIRPDSMSSPAQQGWEEHRGWFPWATDPELIPAAAVREGVAVDAMRMPALDPAPVAVVIPVGPGHGRYVIDAVDSVDAQTFRYWECVVVNDSGLALPPLPSWVRVVENACGYCSHDAGQHRLITQEGSEIGRFCSACEGEDTGCVGYRARGTSYSRNAGIGASRAPLFLPLDADDYLQPRCLELMMENYLSGPEPAVIYSDFWEDPHAVGEFSVWRTPDYDPRSYLTRGLGRAVTALTPKRAWERVGGYDEGLHGWEDWAFAISCAAIGVCERRIALPLFTYRKHTGQRRNANVADFEQSKAAIMAKDFGVQPGGELMACNTCGSGVATTAWGSFANSEEPITPPEDFVLIRYIGPIVGAVSYRSGAVPGTTYRFGRTDPEGYVHKDDAAVFIARGDFEEMPQAPSAAAAATDAPPLVAARTPGAVAVAAPPQAPPPFSPFSPFGQRPEAAPVAPEPAAPEEPPFEPPFIDDVKPDERLPEMPVVPSGPSEAARALAAQHTRAELNNQAIAAGLEGMESLRTKEEVAQAILVRRSMM